MAKKNAILLKLILRWIAQFSRDMDRCSKISDLTILYFAISPCTMHNLFVSSFTLVPTKKCNIVDTSILRGIAKFWRDRDRCSEIAGIVIPYSY